MLGPDLSGIKRVRLMYEWVLEGQCKGREGMGWV